MSQSPQATLVSFMIAVCWSAAVPAYAQHSGHAAKAASPSASVAVLKTSATLRDLWLGHVFWVRNVVLETGKGNAAAAAAAEKEVVANARQISAAIEPYYGKAASDKLFGLLAGHYGEVKHYLEATVADSKSRQDAAMKSLTDNAGDIAVFLSSANPNLPVDTVRSLLVAHGGHHVLQIQQLRDKQYAQEAKTWEAMKNHMYVIADAMAAALVKQFPARDG
jgi:hypothetical protein